MASISCHRCGKPALQPIEREGLTYCCVGCFRLEELEVTAASACPAPGAETWKGPVKNARWQHLRTPAYRERMVRMDSEGMATSTLYIPDMSCASCVAFLERLPAKHHAIQRAEVNFPRKELRLAYDEVKLPLDSLAALLDRLGYPPEVRERHVEEAKPKDRTPILRLIVAGCCFAAMVSFSFTPARLRDFVGWSNLLLSLPVLFFSARGYFESAWKALRSKGLNMDVPIALGMAVIFVRSAADWFLHSGMGYFDSLSGLAFFLLIGKWYQLSTHSKLSHERDYKSWFPINVIRLSPMGENTSVPISSLSPGDRIRIHHGEIVPADSILVSGSGQIDRSFITGESHPVAVQSGQPIEAGGRQVGGAIELKVERPVAQSELTRLWNSDAFQKDLKRSIQDPVDRISRHFTATVLAIATLTFLFWIKTDAAVAWEAFTATLIVACPCALALSLPFTYGSALRWFGRAGAYLKNALVVERMAQVSDLVFDKTGTLTATTSFETQFQSLPGTTVNQKIRELVASAAASSAHPLSRAITRMWPESQAPVEAYEESPGAGIAATVGGSTINLGTPRWVGATEADIQSLETTFPFAKGDVRPTFSYLSMDDRLVGRFAFTKPMREGIDAELTDLASMYRLHLISGDSDAEKETFAKWFPPDDMHFQMRPEEKMDYIKDLHSNHPGAITAMIGDGLNDAGALKIADLGIAVVDDLYAFSPASDMILDARALKNLGAMLRFAREARRTVYLLFGISFAYNFIGLYFAVQGLLTPVVAAILMPVSSITVVAVAMGRTRWAMKRSGLGT